MDHKPKLQPERRPEEDHRVVINRTLVEKIAGRKIDWEKVESGVASVPVTLSPPSPSSMKTYTIKDPSSMKTYTIKDLDPSRMTRQSYFLVGTDIKLRHDSECVDICGRVSMAIRVLTDLQDRLGPEVQLTHFTDADDGHMIRALYYRELTPAEKLAEDGAGPSTEAREKAELERLLQKYGAPKT